MRASWTMRLAIERSTLVIGIWHVRGHLQKLLAPRHSILRVLADLWQMCDSLSMSGVQCTPREVINVRTGKRRGNRTHNGGRTYGRIPWNAARETIKTVSATFLLIFLFHDQVHQRTCTSIEKGKGPHKSELARTLHRTMSQNTYVSRQRLSGGLAQRRLLRQLRLIGKQGDPFEESHVGMV